MYVLPARRERAGDEEASNSGSKIARPAPQKQSQI